MTEVLPQDVRRDWHAVTRTLQRGNGRSKRQRSPDRVEVVVLAVVVQGGDPLFWSQPEYRPVLPRDWSSVAEDMPETEAERQAVIRQLLMNCQTC